MTKRQKTYYLEIFLVSLAVLSVFFQIGLDAVVAAWLGEPLFVRIGIAVAMMAPLGLCLGAFIPIGLKTFAESTEHHEEYVAWCWAINGFFAVTGSVLSSVISMSVGFNVLLLIALTVYCVGVFSITGAIKQLDQQQALSATKRAPTLRPTGKYSRITWFNSRIRFLALAPLLARGMGQHWRVTRARVAFSSLMKTC